MINKLLLNNNARNHIKIMPLYQPDDIPENEGDKIRWCESKFNELQNSGDAIKLYHYSNRKKGIMIAVWELYDLYYLIQSIRNEFGTYNNVIYINNDKNDTLNIAKFLRTNYTQIMDDYKKQILEANDYLKENSIDGTDCDTELPA